ncbi:tRNA (adenosine(37)-N6)-dimethylallyltransferase MiaA [Sandarakinorhabdus glacialis]|nr:tRNA (adenosine(37)-N6)-dimethylallyltransferase MiaA [Polymorphobacter glacialis]
MVAVITGATASGKSALAMAVAERIGGTIINADASQMYADLRVITARPSVADEARVPHLLYGALAGDEIGHAASWAAMAHAAIDDVLAVGRVPILVGGTGLYLTTLIDGIAPVPEIDADVRAAVRGLETVDAAAALLREDPALAARLKAADRQRILRGLEVVRSSGRSLLAWQAVRSGGIGTAYKIRPWVAEMPRPMLNERATARLWAMVEGGALDEVAALLARGLPDDRPVMRALGVAAFGSILRGEATVAEAVEKVATGTRQYQKRQSTWARSQAGDWPRVSPSDPDAAALLAACIFSQCK